MDFSWVIGTGVIAILAVFFLGRRSGHSKGFSQGMKSGVDKGREQGAKLGLGLGAVAAEHASRKAYEVGKKHGSPTFVMNASQPSAQKPESTLSKLFGAVFVVGLIVLFVVTR